MDYLRLSLRLIHIASAVFWVGSSTTMLVFIAPTVAGAAEAGQKFLGQLITHTRLVTAITVSAILTVLAGLSLYWIDSDGLKSGWSTSGVGTGFGLGGLFGIFALVFGIMIGRNMSALGAIAAGAQGKPTPEQVARIQGIQKQMRVLGPLHLLTQIVAVICMATARYWVF